MHCFWNVGGNRTTRRKPKQALEENANHAQEGWHPDSNPLPLQLWRGVSSGRPPWQFIYLHTLISECETCTAQQSQSNMDCALIKHKSDQSFFLFKDIQAHAKTFQGSSSVARKYSSTDSHWFTFTHLLKCRTLSVKWYQRNMFTTWGCKKRFCIYFTGSRVTAPFF